MEWCYIRSLLSLREHMMEELRSDQVRHPEVEGLAQELLSAYETGRMVAVLPSARPGFDLDAAYDVEACLKLSREAGGHKSVGRKVGYANKAMWRMLKLETLVWGHMY